MRDRNTFAYIEGYVDSCRSTLNNTAYGASNGLYKQDHLGRLIDIAEDNLINYDVDAGTIWLGAVGAAGGSFKYLEVLQIDGVLECREYIHNDVGTDEYYVNAVLQTLPSSPAGLTIALNINSLIGTTTTVEARGLVIHDEGQVYTIDIVNADYDRAVDLYTNYLTDDSGEFLTDADGTKLFGNQKLNPRI